MLESTGEFLNCLKYVCTESYPGLLHPICTMYNVHDNDKILIIIDSILQVITTPY